MNLISIPKPAVGFHYTGTFQNITDLQEFLTAQGYTIQSMSFNASQDMLFGVSMTLGKSGLQGETQTVYTSFNTRPDRIIVAPSNSVNLLVFTQEQLESEYTVVE